MIQRTSSDFKDKYKLCKSLIGAFAEEARLCDEKNTFPEKNFALIKSNDLLELIVPKRFGGTGLNFYEYQQCIKLLAKGCASTAAGFNMHCIVLGGLSEIPFNSLDSKQAKVIMPFVERVFFEVIKQKKIFASATTEPGIGARYSKTKTTYLKVDGGYLINGEKSFVSMANYADYYSIIATKKSENEGNTSSTHHLSFFIIPREQDGVKIINNWNTLGMRATQSQRVIFNNVFIPFENVFMGVTGFALEKIVKSPHWVIGGYTGVYLGVMEAALDFTVNYIAKRTDIEKQQGLGFEPLIQARLGEMYAMYEHARNSVDNAANLVLENSLEQKTHMAIYLAKLTIGELAIQLTSLAIKTCGGMSIHKNFDLERYFRDSRCCAIMPAVSDCCQLFLGRSLLGLPTNSLW